MCLLFLLSRQGPEAPKKATCSRQDAILADAEASSLKTWTDIHNSFKKFAQCVDGALSEGYSDSFVRHLSDDWQSIDQLSQFVSRDKEFEAFVLHHIDDLMSPAEMQKIRDNAGAHCTPGARRLCSKIIGQIDRMAHP